MEPGTATSRSCIFCAIVSGDERATIVFEDVECVAFLAIHPAAAGHTVVVPRAHFDDILTIDSEAWASLARTAHAVGGLLQDRLNPDGLTLLQNNKAAGWQSVFHVHVHVVPRYIGDDLIPPWREVPQSRDELEVIGGLLGARHQPGR
jgi:histidine triad (HIT) family protein